MGGSSSKEKAPKGKKSKAPADAAAPAKPVEDIGSRADSGVDVLANSTSAASSPKKAAPTPASSAPAPAPHSSTPANPTKEKGSEPAAATPSKQSSSSEAKKEPAAVAAAASPAAAAAPESAKKGEAAEDGKLFAAPKGPQRSKIYQALNPEKLWYETRREKEEAKGDTVHIAIRGGGAGMANTAVDFALERDDEGNIIEDHLDFVQEVEESYDPDNLPDFGELQGELDALRKERAEKQRQHQEDLRRRWQEKKAAEEAVRKAELERIAEEEAARERAKPSQAADFVTNAQSRLQRESEENFRTFSFKG